MYTMVFGRMKSNGFANITDNTCCLTHLTGFGKDLWSKILHVSLDHCLIYQSLFHLNISRELWKLEVVTMWVKYLNRNSSKETLQIARQDRRQCQHPQPLEKHNEIPQHIGDVRCKVSTFQFFSRKGTTNGWYSLDGDVKPDNGLGERSPAGFYRTKCTPTLWLLDRRRKAVSTQRLVHSSFTHGNLQLEISPVPINRNMNKYTVADFVHWNMTH